MLDNCSIDNLSIEIYENQFFKSDFTQIRVYMFRLSFLTTLNIYKDYFKSSHSGCNLLQKNFTGIFWPKTYALVYISLEEVAAFIRCRVL